MQVRRTSSRIPFSVVMLGLVSFFTDAASEMLYPLIPIFVAALGSGALMLGIIEGVAETMASLLKFVSGVWSDRVRRKKFLIILGYSISSFVRPFTGFVTDAGQIVAVRLIDRIGKGIRTSPRDAMVAAAVDESIRGRAFGLQRAFDHAGAVLGPILAIITLLLSLGVFHVGDVIQAMRWTFIASIVPGLLAVSTLVVLVKEEPVEPVKGLFRKTFASFDANFARYLLVVAFFTLGNSSDAFLLFRVQEALGAGDAARKLVEHSSLLRFLVERFGSIEQQRLAVSILALPLIWSVFHVLKSLLSTPLGAISDRVGRKKVITIGWAVYASVYLGFAFLDGVPQNLETIYVLSLFFIYSMYYAFTEGVERAFVADLVPAEIRGRAYGAFNLTVGIGALPASILFGAIYGAFGRYGGFAAFLMGASFAVAAMILLAVMVKEKPGNGQGAVSRPGKTDREREGIRAGPGGAFPLWSRETGGAISGARHQSLPTPKASATRLM